MDVDVLGWNWATIGQTVIGAGFGTALVQGGFAVYRDAHRRRAQAAYMSMRLAVLLEAYAAACAALISENSVAETAPDEEFPNWQVKLPELAPYPEDEDGWRAIDRKLAGQCLNLTNKISGNQVRIGVTIEYNEDALEDVVAESAAKLGLEAWALAEKLRRRSHIEQADTSWNYPDTLKEALERAEKSQTKREERHAKFSRELFERYTRDGPATDGSLSS